MNAVDTRFDEAKFSLGRLIHTSGVLGAITPEDVLTALKRHAKGDWGDLSEEDRQANEVALQSGDQLLSSYQSSSGIKFWLITECDRSVTTALLPTEH